RGYRIELAEIEAVLSEHSLVQEAVVVARHREGADKQLVAYLVGKDGAQIAVAELKAHLQSKLPEYMIPSAFVMLESIPLTPNKKVDRKALPAPTGLRTEYQAHYLAPRDNIELQLVHIWEELLNLSPIGVKDNFFDLGGHSLLTVRMMAKIEKLFGRALPLSTVFQGSTVEQLASILRQETILESSLPLVALQPNGSKHPFFCIHAIGGNVFSYVELARHLGSQQPFYGLAALGLQDEQEPLTSIEEMASCYISAIRKVQPSGPYLIGGWSFGGVVAFELAQQLTRAGQQVEVLALIDSAAPGIAETDQPVDDRELLIGFMRELSNSLTTEQYLDLHQLSELAAEEQLNYMLEWAVSSYFLPPGSGHKEIRKLFQVYQTNYRARASYRASIYPGQAILFRSEQRFIENQINPMMGWQHLVTAGVQVEVVPGNHYTLLRKPNVEKLALLLSSAFNRIQSQ
ncbi:MAG: thioesterase domain-containing protein, partial [Acidobacteriota bacterium]